MEVLKKVKLLFIFIRLVLKVAKDRVFEIVLKERKRRNLEENLLKKTPIEEKMCLDKMSASDGKSTNL